MCWKTSSELEEKIRFVMEYERDEEESCVKHENARVEIESDWTARVRRPLIAMKLR